jgi:hypothetical protein
MRNRIPEVTEAAVIEDFYRGSNDSAFVRAILQKAPTTSEELFREADLYITADERAQDLIGGAKPTPPAPRRDANQQPDKRWEKRPHEEVHVAGPLASRARGGPRGGERTLDDILDAQCPYHKDMRHTLWNCRDFKHSIGHDRPSNLYLLRRGEGQKNHDNPSSRRREEEELSCALMGRSTSSSADMDRRRIEDNKSSTIARYWWRPPVLPPHTGGRSTQSLSLGRINVSTSTTQTNTHSSSIR